MATQCYSAESKLFCYIYIKIVNLAQVKYPIFITILIDYHDIDLQVALLNCHHYHANLSVLVSENGRSYIHLYTHRHTQKHTHRHTDTDTHTL